MAHEIDENYAFFNRTPAWHGLGTVFADNPSVEEAWQALGGFTLHELPVAAVIDNGNEYPDFMKMTDYKAIVRSDGRQLSIMGSGYKLEQTLDIMHQTMDALCSSGEVILESGGFLREGRQFWSLFKINGADADIAPGDSVRGYLLNLTSFDGSLARQLSLTNVRVVCANTLAWSMAQTKGAKRHEYRTKHTKNMSNRIDSMLAQIDLARGQFNESVEAYQYLASKPMRDSQQTEYFSELIIGDNDEPSTKLKNKLYHVLDIRDMMREKELVPVRGTAWEAYNAISNYVTHEHGRNQDSRLAGQWYGSSASLNDRALELALN